MGEVEEAEDNSSSSSHLNSPQGYLTPHPESLVPEIDVPPEITPPCEPLPPSQRHRARPCPIAHLSSTAVSIFEEHKPEPAKTSRAQKGHESCLEGTTMAWLLLIYYHLAGELLLRLLIALAFFRRDRRRGWTVFVDEPMWGKSNPWTQKMKNFVFSNLSEESVSCVPGIGSCIAKRLCNHNIRTVRDLYSCYNDLDEISFKDLIKRCGGHSLHQRYAYNSMYWRDAQMNGVKGLIFFKSWTGVMLVQ